MTAYISTPETAVTVDPKEGLSGAALAKRFGLDRTAVNNRYAKDAPDKFRQWCIDNLGGVAWEKRGRKFYQTTE